MSLTVFVPLLLLSAVEGQKMKSWKPSVDFEDSVNWNLGKTPSSVDVAVFQEDTAVPVVLPSVGVDICALILPNNGQVILKPNAVITVSASLPSYSAEGIGCTGQTVKFKKNSPLSWADPDNWSSEASSATPHVERIPCVHDTVVFNPDNSFSAYVPDIQINVGAVKFGNQTFGQNELNEFLVTDVGDQELKSTSPNNQVSITLTTTDCDDPTGCECGTENLLDDVCRTESKRCAKKLGCVNPVKPEGHCCWICGAYFLVHYNPRSYVEKNFKNALNETVKDIVGKFKGYGLNFHAQKLVNGILQFVIFSDGEYVDEIDKIAQQINEKLSSSYANLGITNVKMYNSGLSYNVDGMTYGQMALFTCIVTVSFMLATMFYYTGEWRIAIFNPRSSAGVVQFVKFDNDNIDVEMIDEDPRVRRKTSFSNPTYGAIENSPSDSQNINELRYSDLPTTSKSNNDNNMDVELVETGDNQTSST
ncbi:protein amnionless [Adelges cooleyi]|uniref:protein amnionless n=1 Tax=Adelges cooleyi TaxID=133065 RepID=UPI0021803825|nr:protein amnionless [Adelges cooleyi]